MDSKSQRNGVQNELKRLREAQLASNQRDKLKDVSCAALTTPEEAQRFLNAMREKQHEREVVPAHLRTSADGMNTWYMQQRQKDQELKNRKREAEAILRNYRGTAHLSSSGSRDPSPKEGYDPQHMHEGSDVGSPASSYHYQPGSFAGIPNTSSASPSIGNGSHAFFDNSSHHRKMMDHHSNSYYGEEKKESHEPRESISPRFTPSPNFGSASNHSSNNHHHGRNFLSPPLPEGLANNSTPNMETSSFHQRQNSFRSRNSTGNGLQVDTAAEPNKGAETVWRDFVSNKPGSKFTAEPGRYHLYGSYACPGTHRALIVRALKGLQDVISVTYLHPVWRLTNPKNPSDKHRGWVFGDAENGEPFMNTIGKGGPFPPAYDDNEPDPSNVKASSIREIYEYANDTSGKYTIPLLWDTKLKTIVNNESSDIAYMFNSCFNDFAQNPSLDLYTEDDVEEKTKLYQVSEWLSPLMIHGVYRCGFAKTQWAYDRAINDLCAAFDRADDTLEQQRYLTGDTLTDVDIRLFVTLLRFDEVYTVYFKANARLVMLTPSLLNFCRDIFQMPGVAETCNMEQIKAHFFASHAEWNKYSVIPRGLGFMELLDMPHDRDYGFGGNRDNGGIMMIHPPGEEEYEDFVQDGGSQHNVFAIDEKEGPGGGA